MSHEYYALTTLGMLLSAAAVAPANGEAAQTKENASKFLVQNLVNAVTWDCTGVVCLAYKSDLLTTVHSSPDPCKLSANLQTGPSVHFNFSTASVKRNPGGVIVSVSVPQTPNVYSGPLNAMHFAAGEAMDTRIFAAISFLIKECQDRSLGF